MNYITQLTLLLFIVLLVMVGGMMAVKHEMQQEATMKLVEQEQEFKNQYVMLLEKLQKRLKDQKKLEQDLWLCRRNR